MNVTSTVTNLEMKTSRNGKTYTVIHHQNEKGTFKQNCFEDLAGITVGDTVNMEMEKNGQYWNLKSISKIVSTAPMAATASSGNGPSPHLSEERKQVYIAKSVALKASIDFVHNAVGQRTNGKEVLKEVLDVADVFTKWLLQSQEERAEEVVALLAEGGDIFDEATPPDVPFD